MAGNGGPVDAEEVMRRLRVWQQAALDLVARWWAAEQELEVAERRLARLEATKEAQVSRLLDGMTQRQRAAIEQRPGLSWSSGRGRRYREAVRRGQVWAHRKPRVVALEASWQPRLDDARRQVHDGRRTLASLAVDAVRMFDDPEPYLGRSRRQLLHVAGHHSSRTSVLLNHPHPQ